MSQDVGLKQDQDKAPLDLIPYHSVLEIAKVLDFGAKKYGKHNWRKGLAFSRLIAACLRHLTAYNEGEDKDNESGLSHLSHAGACILFLLEYERSHPQLDDRYKNLASKSKKE